MALSMRDEPGTQREYETIFILRPDTNQDGITLVNTRVRSVIEQMGLASFFLCVWDMPNEVDLTGWLSSTAHHTHRS